jgi:hypothetical protein
MSRVTAMMAPFETFAEHYQREQSGEPYNEAFIKRCRKEALKYDKMDVFLRSSLLCSLEKCVPLHYRGKVFDGISSFD